MLALGKNNLYDYRIQSLTQVEQALVQLLAAKEKMMGLNIESMGKFYEYMESLHLSLNTPIKDKPLLALTQAAIGFLDKDLLEIFLNDPTDESMRDNVAVELLFVAAATDNIKEAQTYTEEQMEQVLKGNDAVIYDDVVFVSSLRKFFQANISKELFSQMTKTLPSVVKEPENMKMYYWDDAFVLGMMLHGIWRHFFLLTSVDQQFLLQNYLYQSIVLGVPVRLGIRDAIQRASVKGELEKTVRFFRENLALGKESIPTNTLSGEGIPLGQVVKNFLTKVATEQINTLVQEKYISDMYRGKEDNEFFSAWLREVLTVVWQLKTGDIVK